jgi:hypothetical protein
LNKKQTGKLKNQRRVTMDTKMPRENKIKGGKTMKKVAVPIILVLALMASLLVGCAKTSNTAGEVQLTGPF